MLPVSGFTLLLRTPAVLRRHSEIADARASSPGKGRVLQRRRPGAIETSSNSWVSARPKPGDMLGVADRPTGVRFGANVLQILLNPFQNGSPTFGMRGDFARD